MKRAISVFLAIILFLIPLSVQAEEINKEDPDTFTLLWTTDPQWYSFAYPEILTHQNDWVVENYKRLGIEYIIHTGDFVDMPNKTEQWETVTKEYEKWDNAGIPYGVLAGNHDVNGTDYSAFSSYFGRSRYDKNSWYGGDYKDNKGHYDLLTLGGADLLFLYIGYGTPTTEDINWMNGVLEQYRDRVAFLMFHEFLDAEGNRTAVGDEYFEKVVLKNSNVRLVLCGHNYNSARRSDSIDDDGDGLTDRTVHQLIANYQDTPKGGNGYMRFMECDVKKGTISCRTYSPYLKDFNYFESTTENMDIYGYRDEFVLTVDFSAATVSNGKGRVVDDPFAALIDVESGEKEVVPIEKLNKSVDEAFEGVGLYDNTFSLRTGDISPDGNAQYVIAEYVDKVGYVVRTVTRDNVLIPERAVVLAFFGKESSFASTGNILALTRADNLAPPISETSLKLYVYDHKAVFGIDSVAGSSNRFAIFDSTHGDTVKAGKNEALLLFEPLADHDGVYRITQALTEKGESKSVTLTDGSFALKTNMNGKSTTYRQSFEDIFFVGASAALSGYVPEVGIIQAGESILSKDPSDWSYDKSTMIAKQKDDALVLSNNNGLWPDGKYTLPQPMTFDPEVSVLYYDFTIQNGGKTSILLLIGDQYVKLNSHFSGVTISQGSGDVKGDGSNTTGTLSFNSLDIPKSCYNDDGTVTLYGMQIYACGTKELTTSYRDFRVITGSQAPVWPEYTPPSREESKEPSDDLKTDNAESNVKEPNNNNDYLVFVISGVVLLAVIVVIALLRTKKKN
ncbi:MAG: metallophosphoesterase [Clostridia bacterium]|nr:metallophosphoesterase [Clostridia bacterium]